jgi:hypothetical protein
VADAVKGARQELLRQYQYQDDAQIDALQEGARLLTEALSAKLDAALERFPSRPVG